MFSCIVLELSKDKVFSLKKALGLIDPEIIVYAFSELQKLQEWVQKIVEKDEEVKEVKDIALIVTDHRIMGLAHEKLIFKLQEYFKGVGLAFEGRSPTVLLSVNELEEISSEELMAPFVSNVLFKPYDPVIVKERVRWAVFGVESVGEEELFAQKAQAVPVEMIRDVHVERITELGFRTVSVRKIEKGRIAKYYGDLFGQEEGEENESVLAICTKSIPHPVHDDQFSCSFSFFAAGDRVIKSVRRFIKSHEDALQVAFPVSSVGEDYFFVVVIHNNERRGLIVDSLRRTFENLKVYAYEFTDQLLWDLGLKEPEIDTSKGEAFIKKYNQFSGKFCALLVDDLATEFRSQEYWLEIKKTLCQGDDSSTMDSDKHLFLISPEKMSPYDEIISQGHFSDCFLLPFDMYYFLRKVNHALLQLRPAEKTIFREYVDLQKKIHAVIPVWLDRGTEASISFPYYRALPERRFRHFKLLIEGVSNHPTLLAQCLKSEDNPQSSDESDRFLLHFVFYGPDAGELEFIRQWTLKQYFIAKQSAET